MKKSHLAAITFSMVLALLVSFSIASAQTIDPADWQYRKAIIIDAGQVTADLNNFPLLVKTTDAHLLANAKSTGIDILFTADNGTDLLDYEIESYDDTTGLVAWVKIPSLDDTTNTVIYMYYGNGSAANQESAAAVWDTNYVMVQHLEETTGDHLDSTSFLNHGTPSNDLTQDATGKINGADEFDGSDYVACGDHISLDTTGSMTIEAWAYSNNTGKSTRIASKDPIGSKGKFIFWKNGEGKLAFQVIDDTSTDWFMANGSSVPDGEWMYVVGVFDAVAQKVRLYTNGNEEIIEVDGPSTLKQTSDSFTIGGPSSANGQFWNGRIDEVRVSNMARSADWILTNYNNQNDPGSFYTVGPLETEYPIVSNPDPANNAIGVPISTTELCFDQEDQQGDTLTYTVTSGIGSDSGNAVPPYEQPYCIGVSGLVYGTTYEWTVTVNDNDGHITEQTYSFTTEKESVHCAWGYRKAIAIDHTKVAEDLTNFPVLIELTNDTDLALNAQDDGDDIVFTDNKGFQLDHEIEFYDAGHLVAWVEIPSLSSTTDTLIYMYYGNPTATDQGNPPAVWDTDYVMVHHLNETSLNHIDSTSNGNDGIASVTTQGSADGQINGADEFDGIDDNVNCGNADSLDITGSMTVEAWAYSNNSAVSTRILSKDVVGTPGKFILWKNGSGNLAFIVADSANNWYRAKSGSITNGEWFHVVGVFDNSVNPPEVRLYKDGVEVVDPPVDGPFLLESNSETVTIGASDDNDQNWKGKIDEVRISDTARSSGWIHTSYTNQNDPGSFLDIGDEEFLPADDDAICDGIDDDCDGDADEDYEFISTECGVGACAATGATSCVGGTVADSCTPGTPSDESCDDQIDNDCNGIVDDKDSDSDGYIDVDCGGLDCDDNDYAINPNTAEITSITYEGSYVVMVNDYNTEPPIGDVDVMATLLDNEGQPIEEAGWEVEFMIYNGEDNRVASVTAFTDTLGIAEAVIEDIPVGVYTIETQFLADECYYLGSQDFTTIAVCDPSGGFVTGGGWIDSPEGAYTPDITLTGKANFGFVSKYKKGATVPTGETEFQFKVADLNFHSDTYDWLVIAGARAQYKGTGTINGEGNYGFMLTAIDEKLTPSTDVDMFRIKIWDKDDGDAIVYDNQMDAGDDAEPDTGIGGGSIVIHKGKK